MNAKRYLMKPWILKDSIRQIDEQIEQIRETKHSAGAIRYDQPNVQTSPADTMADYAARLDELERESVRLKTELFETNVRIISQIDGIPNALQAKVLSKRYLDRENFLQIAEDLNYSESYVLHVHRAAVRAFGEAFLRDE